MKLKAAVSVKAESTPYWLKPLVQPFLKLDIRIASFQSSTGLVMQYSDVPRQKIVEAWKPYRLVSISGNNPIVEVRNVKQMAFKIIYFKEFCTIEYLGRYFG